MTTSALAGRRVKLTTVLIALLTLLLTVIAPIPAQADEHDQPIPIRSSVTEVGAILPDVRIQGSGWGHGVGMSQYGAFAQALAGWPVGDILDYYYPGTQISTDQRSSTSRIRVGILNGVEYTSIEAVSGPVNWQRCRPDTQAGETIGGRVTQCRDEDDGTNTWFTQPQGTTLMVCPYREPAQDAEGKTIAEEDRRNGLKILTPEAFNAEDPDAADDPDADDPEDTRVGCDGEFHRHTLAYSVARVAHDGTVIRTPSHAGSRTYFHGWRDLHSRNEATTLSVVQDVPTVEKYMYGLAEVPSSWGQIAPAALQAQAVTGRTFAVGRLGLAGGCACDISATTGDQNYTGYGKESEPTYGTFWVAAVNATADQVLTYDGGLAQTFYSSSHGGRSENIEDSWAYGTATVPYLRSVDDPWSVDPPVDLGISWFNPRSNWDAYAGNAKMAEFLSAGQSEPIVRVERIQVVSRTQGGTPKELDVTGTTAAGSRIRFVTDLAETYSKGIAGGAIRRSLPLESGGFTNNRVYSSQISGFGFDAFDDDDATTHEYAITWLKQTGIADGVAVGEFAPSRAVTREQMATFLVNTFDIPAADPSDFPDVERTNTHAEAIDALAASGVTAGYADGTFRPGLSVTREQMATFISRALALAPGTQHTFTDVTEANTHRDAILAIAELGITEGCGEEVFCPGEPVQRGQMASFLMRMVLN